MVITTIVLVLVLAAGFAIGWTTGFASGRQHATTQIARVMVRNGLGWPPLTRPVKAPPAPPPDPRWTPERAANE